MLAEGFGGRRERKARHVGRGFRCRMCAVFEFEPGGERIVCERVYFDQGTIARQLLEG